MFKADQGQWCKTNYFYARITQAVTFSSKCELGARKSKPVYLWLEVGSTKCVNLNVPHKPLSTHISKNLETHFGVC